MVNYVKGNLLDSNCDYICHQVNCQGVMNSGIARQIRERWPEVYYSYKDTYDSYYIHKGITKLLGSVDIAMITCSTQTVLNMFAQNTCGYDGARYTSYDAFSNCLNEIRSIVPKDKTIGFPKGIGCGLGGGDWRVISALIEEILGEDFDVYIYEWDGE